MSTDFEQKQSEQEVEAEQVKEADTSNNSSVKNDDEITRKIILSLSYLWGILFFIPLIMYKGDAKATRHANEGLVLLLLSVVGNIILGALTAIPAIGWIFGMLAGIYSLAILILGIIGIVYVVTDQDKELPIISKIKILK